MDTLSTNKEKLCVHKRVAPSKSQGKSTYFARNKVSSLIYVCLCGLLFLPTLVLAQRATPTAQPTPVTGTYDSWEKCMAASDLLSAANPTFQGEVYGCPLNQASKKDKVWYPASGLSIEYDCTNTKKNKWVLYPHKIIYVTFDYHTFNSIKYGCMNSSYVKSIERRTHSYCEKQNKVVVTETTNIKNGSIKYSNEIGSDGSPSVKTTITPYTITNTAYEDSCAATPLKQFPEKNGPLQYAGSCLPEDLNAYRSRKSKSSIPDCVSQTSFTVDFERFGSKDE